MSASAVLSSAASAGATLPSKTRVVFQTSDGLSYPAIRSPRSFGVPATVADASRLVPDILAKYGHRRCCGFAFEELRMRPVGHVIHHDHHGGAIATAFEPVVV